MLDRALLSALIAFSLVLGMNEIGDAMAYQTKTLGCAFQSRVVCVHDDQQDGSERTPLIALATRD